MLAASNVNRCNMRHTFISLSLLFSMNLGAQQIAQDVAEPGGLRIISTTLETCRNASDKVVLSIGLTSYTKQNTTFTLNIKATATTPITIPKRSALLIKTFNGTIIELYSTNTADGCVRDVHNINGFVFSDYSATPSYDITLEQIHTIANEGLSKIRIQTSTSTIDKEYKKDKAGKVIRTDLTILKDALHINKDFHDGF